MEQGVAFNSLNFTVNHTERRQQTVVGMKCRGFVCPSDVNGNKLTAFNAQDQRPAGERQRHELRFQPRGLVHVGRLCPRRPRQSRRFPAQSKPSPGGHLRRHEQHAGPRRTVKVYQPLCAFSAGLSNITNPANVPSPLADLTQWLQNTHGLVQYLDPHVSHVLGRRQPALKPPMTTAWLPTRRSSIRLAMTATWRPSCTSRRRPRRAWCRRSEPSRLVAITPAASTRCSLMAASLRQEHDQRRDLASCGQRVPAAR